MLTADVNTHGFLCRRSQGSKATPSRAIHWTDVDVVGILKIYTKEMNVSCSLFDGNAYCFCRVVNDMSATMNQREASESLKSLVLLSRMLLGLLLVAVRCVSRVRAAP